MPTTLRRVRTPITQFPFCVGTDEKLLELPATTRPDGVSDPSGMDYAMKWWWRVRKWNFSHTSFISGGAPFRATQNEEFFAHDFTLTAGPPAPAAERYLKRPCDGDMTFHSNYLWENGGNSNDPITGLPPPLSWQWNFALFLGGPSAGVGLVDGIASIAFNISFLQEDGHILQSSPSGEFGDINSPNTTAEIYIDGVRIPIMYQDPDDGEWSGRVDFEPIEFWPYPLPDGSEPIYDTATGAVLPGMSPHEDRLK